MTVAEAMRFANQAMADLLRLDIEAADACLKSTKKPTPTLREYTPAGVNEFLRSL